jgi:dolichyl-phosphate-mannose-protein mannosyltransferase
MRETIKIKMEKLFSRKRFVCILVTALAFLVTNKKIPLTDRESEFILSLKAYKNGAFYFTRDLPFPGLVYHGIFLLVDHLQPALVPLFFSLVRPVNVLLLSATISGVFILLNKMAADTLPLVTALALALDPLLTKFSLVSTNSTFSLFFSVYSMLQLKKRNEAISAVFLSLAISCSWQALSVYPALLIVLSIDRFSMLINPKKAVYGTLVQIIRDVALFILGPAAVYVSLFWLQYSIQTHASGSSNIFSVEFRATLIDPEQEFTDKYLMDRSVVTILNQKHRSYLNIEDGIPYGSAVKNTKSMWKIIKVHRVDENNVAEEDPNEGRYIKNGDFVKLAAFSTETCLRVANEENDDKFKKIVSGVHQDDHAAEEDLWVVVGEGRVVARQSLIKFRHNKTQMELCMRNLQRSSILSENAASSTTDGEQPRRSESYSKYRKPVNGSIYSAHSSRKFYISDNRNHDYYKSAFKDGLPNEKTYSFPKIGFLKKIWEHHRKLVEAQSQSFYPVPSAVVTNAGRPPLSIAMLVLSLSFPLFATFSRVGAMRHRRSWGIPSEYILVSVMHFSSILIGLSLAADPLYTTFLCACNAWAFISLLGPRASTPILVATLASLAKEKLQ